MNLVKNLILLSFFFALAACSNLSSLSKKIYSSDDKPVVKTASVSTNFKSTAIFYKDGRQAYISKCEGNSWLACMTDAGETCKNNGYEILEKNTSKETSVFFADKDIKELYYICKKIESLEQKLEQKTDLK